MNELYVDECWLYFKIKEVSKEEAIKKLYEACDAAGIELTIENSALRNEDGDRVIFPQPLKTKEKFYVYHIHKRI